MALMSSLQRTENLTRLVLNNKASIKQYYYHYCYYYYYH